MTICGVLGGPQIGAVLGTGAGAAALPCYYLTFDAVPDDYISLAGIAITRPFTMVAWINRQVKGFVNGIIGSGFVDSQFSIQAADYMYGRHAAPGGGYSAISTILTGWTHVAWICRSSVAVNAVFRNGVDITSAPGTTNANAATYNRIGLTTRSMNGQMAAIGIAPGELDIAALWAAGTLHRPLNPAVFTHACWNMRQEGGAGTTLIDEAIGNDGTFKGAGEPAWGGLMSVGGPAGWSDS